MRRFSQRNSLVTLNDINITPLLDLAFVLLLIFIITRPLLEQGMPLQLPKGGATDGKVEAKDIKQVDVTVSGQYKFGSQNVSLDDLENKLIQIFKSNPNAVIYIRADENGYNKHVYALIDRCQKRGMTRFSLRTSPTKAAR